MHGEHTAWYTLITSLLPLTSGLLLVALAALAYRAESVVPVAVGLAASALILLGKLVIGSNVTEPPDGKVYELWFLPEGGARMEPAGTFAPRRGSVHASVQLGKSFTALAVSVEPRGGSEQPTTAPLYLARIPAGS